jgi:23S rRNA (cytidine1920-2'-O)/16S rRNA (cytidine1409-2'-O)-methyltransferase
MGRRETSLKPRVRLDVILVERGLAPSRERARALIMAGRVRAAGITAPKPGTPVPSDIDVMVEEPDHPYVGRGGLKLAHALDHFGIAVAQRSALDIGASTGGFSDVLLQRGARHVVALDVGHGQIDWKLRKDPRVLVLEGVNARYLTPDQLPGRVDVVTIDVSFISLRLILPVVPPVLEPHADIVALVKPQFEAGRQDVARGGLVKDPEVHDRVIDEVSQTAAAIGLATIAMTPSPITGAAGNREFLLHLREHRP